MCRKIALKNKIRYHDKIDTVLTRVVFLDRKLGFCKFIFTICAQKQTYIFYRADLLILGNVLKTKNIKVSLTFVPDARVCFAKICVENMNKMLTMSGSCVIICNWNVPTLKPGIL